MKGDFRAGSKVDNEGYKKHPRFNQLVENISKSIRKVCTQHPFGLSLLDR